MNPATAAEKKTRPMSRILHVDNQHPRAHDGNTGSQRQPLRSINAAAQLAKPGDTVLVHPGIYRERVCPANSGEAGRPITFQAAERRTVVIKGSEVLTGTWTRVAKHPGVFRASLAGLKLGKANPFAISYQLDAQRCVGQVILDGQLVTERRSEAELVALPGSWRAVDGGKAIQIHLPTGMVKPEEAEIEVSVRRRVFAPLTRGISHIVVRGFVMEHAANNYCGGFYNNGPPQDGLLGCRGGHHWVIEDNEIRFAKSFGLDIGYEGAVDGDGLNQPPALSPGHHLVQANHIHHNGSGGICGCISPRTRILHNCIEYNETNASGADESAGVKLHFCYDALIEGNLFRGNDCPGIWLDNNWRGARVTRNTLIDNAGAGIFIELGDGPLLIDNNIIANTRGTMALAGDGIYAHDASGITVAHNLLWFNGNFGLWAHIGSERYVNFFAEDPRKPASGEVLGDKLHYPWSTYLTETYPRLTWADRHPESSRWQVLNNIVIGNGRGALSLPPEQPRSTGNVSDRNLLCAGYHLTISESWGSPMHQPLLVLNTNKDRVAIADLAQRLDQLPAERRPNPVLWCEMPLCTLEQWQVVAGYDQHSCVPRILRPRLGLQDLVLDLVIDDSAARVGCQPVEGVDRDLLGAPLPRQPLAGPCQNLQAATEFVDGKDYATPHRGAYERLGNPAQRNRIPLWPIQVRSDATRTQP